MKLELKNIRVNLAFSQETTMFKADLFVNGKKVAYANNDGHGGCTFYRVYDKSLNELLSQAEEYATTLPSKYHTFLEKTFEIKSTLENWIDFSIDDYVKEKETAKFKKKMEKDMLNYIVYGLKENAYTRIGWSNVTIAQMLISPNGRQVLLSKLNEIKNTGNKIFNTNIPKDFLELA
jgi:hypothetical protein